MKMIRQEACEQGFPYIAYIPENISSHPGLLIQLHGAGERGSGGGMAWNAHTLTMPTIWAFHGLEDTLVSPSQTIEMVEALKDINPNLKYDLWAGVGHDSWNQAFTAETLNWILLQKKSE